MHRRQQAQRGYALPCMSVTAPVFHWGIGPYAEPVHSPSTGASLRHAETAAWMLLSFRAGRGTTHAAWQLVRLEKLPSRPSTHLYDLSSHENRICGSHSIWQRLRLENTRPPEVPTLQRWVIPSQIYCVSGGAGGGPGGGQRHCVVPQAGHGRPPGHNWGGLLVGSQ